MVSWSSEIYQEPVFSDVNGGSVTNSAGDYYIDPVPTRDNVHLIAKIRSNVTSVPAWVLSKQNNVNSGVIVIGGLSIAAGLARMSRLEIGERQIRGTTSFYQVSFEIHIHEVGWHLTPLDVGFRRLVTGEPVQIRTDDTGATVLCGGGSGEIMYFTIDTVNCPGDGNWIVTPTHYSGGCKAPPGADPYTGEYIVVPRDCPMPEMPDELLDQEGIAARVYNLETCELEWREIDHCPTIGC
jgi:hypothetical protein